MLPKNPESNRGKITSVRGRVLEADFPAKIPPVYRLLRTEGTHVADIVVISRTGTRTVRCLSLSPAVRIARNTGVKETDRELDIPIAPLL